MSAIPSELIDQQRESGTGVMGTEGVTDARRFQRPKLCRLCQCPVTSGGVRMTKIDGEPLSQWWLRRFKTQFTDGCLRKKFICQFCIWDSKFLLDNSAEKFDMDCVWWTELVDEIAYKKYFLPEVTKPCSVHLEILAKERDPLNTPKKSPVQTSCVYCYLVVSDRKSLWEHMRRTHPDALRCSHKSCASYFRSDAERQLHVELVHKGDGKRQCVYCGDWTTVKNLRAHTQTLHRDVAIGCNIKANCCNFFLTIKQRNEHIKNAHFAEKIKQRLSCIFCSNKYTTHAALAKHTNKWHAHAVKCSFNRCAKFFKSQSDFQLHFKEKHGPKSKLRLHRCPKCDYQTIDKTHLRGHFDIKHGFKSLKCHKCPNSMIYKSDYALRNHMQVVHCEKKKCPHCKMMLKKMHGHLRSEFCGKCKKKVLCSGLMRNHRLRCK